MTHNYVSNYNWKFNFNKKINWFANSLISEFVLIRTYWLITCE